MSNNNFPELFGSLRNLRFLDLHASFDGGRIPNNLARLLHLQYLDISSSVQSLINLKISFVLQYLDLSSNDLEGTIPHLGNLSHLQYLDLSGNDLVGTIPHQLGSLSNLQELHLGSNQGLKVHDNNNHAGGEWLSNLTLLTHLDLSWVQNLDSSHVWLQMTGNLKKLEELKLSRSINEDISTILLKLSGCARNSLQDLSLTSNKINGKFPDLSIFPSLIEISLSNNLLSGKVPDGERFLPTKLESLRFGYNSLEGEIPKSFGKLCSLRSLDLSSNKLSEYISVILQNLSVGRAKYSLQDLNLDRNQIICTIPDMSPLSALENLVLSKNQLYVRKDNAKFFIPRSKFPNYLIQTHSKEFKILGNYLKVFEFPHSITFS
ncbi:putative non-specific serine/threonine protein kinase [Medicago truncatula]|nr:putative non-specific serine/threonine protein kinase [Medicago truncatula]